MIGILLSLSVALSWGAGDFCGGFATRRNNQYQVLAISAISGILVLLAAICIWHETFPSLQGILWSILAGLAGTIGITSLYRGLSLGNAVTVAPTASVIGSVLPVIYTLLTRGAPALTQIIGFLLALLGIWLVSHSATSNKSNPRRGILLGCITGINFGGFYILIAQVDASKLFSPLFLARSIMFIVALFLMSAKDHRCPKVSWSPFALLAGILDAGGDVLFLMAKQISRLDTVVIISSLYSAVTVIMASLFQKEKVYYWQKAGVIFCLLAIVLITL